MGKYNGKKVNGSPTGEKAAYIADKQKRKSSGIYLGGCSGFVRMESPMLVRTK